jgi:AraC-like DNA-binding protein
LERIARPLPQGMRLQPITSALHARQWSFNRAGEPPARLLLCLTDGAAETELDTDSHQIAAPALLWLGEFKSGHVTATAGSTGFIGNIDDEMLVRAIGDHAESVSLRYLVDRSFQLSLSDRRVIRDDIVASLEAILRELAAPQASSPMLIAAYLRIVLVSMMRLSGVEEVAMRARSGNTALLQRFRQLVEMRFREHWPIRRYAEALGISHDRLHALCTRELRRTPKALVAERLAREAGLRLERSALTIEQLSHSLGFRDPAHFSHFFKRRTGLTPGRYRKQMARASAEGPLHRPASFADWP